MAPGLKRREVLAGGAALGWFLIGGSRVQATPADAKRAGFTPQVLTPNQINALETVAEALVPGATDAGLGPYLDAQLAAGNDSMLMARYLGVDPAAQPGFYGGIADSLHAALSKPDASGAALAGQMATDSVPGWSAAPASFAYFLLRADALDVTWGTEEGYAALDIPYMAHIAPETPW